MSDLAIAGALLMFLVGFAITAPIWGYDSRDGIESDQPSRRIAWLYDPPAGQRGRTACSALAGALRAAADRLDEGTVSQPRSHHRLAAAS
jgi:hypothetical protein